MAFRAVSLLGLVVMTVADTVVFVFAAGAPLEVLQPIVGGVIVEMAAFHLRRAGTDEGFKYQPVNQE